MLFWQHYAHPSMKVRNDVPNWVSDEAEEDSGS